MTCGLGSNRILDRSGFVDRINFGIPDSYLVTSVKWIRKNVLIYSVPSDVF